MESTWMIGWTGWDVSMKIQSDMKEFSKMGSWMG